MKGGDEDVTGVGRLGTFSKKKQGMEIIFLKMELTLKMLSE
jgi:hypothetical protein